MHLWAMLSTNASPDSRTEWHAKRYFLTYSRCETSKEELLNHLQSLLNEPGLLYIISREAHADGGAHLHAYLEFPRAKRVRDPRYFDVGDYHPSIETVRDRKACQTYVIKDGDYISNFSVGHGKRTYGEIVKGSANKTEFFAEIEEHYPRDLVLNLARIREFADYKFPTSDGVTIPEVSYEFSSFVMPDELAAWYEDNVVQHSPGEFSNIYP